MTPQTAAALRALESDIRYNAKRFLHMQALFRWADELAAVLTQEGAEDEPLFTASMYGTAADADKARDEWGSVQNVQRRAERAGKVTISYDKGNRDEVVAWLLELPEHRYQNYQKRLYFSADIAEEFGSLAEYPELSTVTPLGRIRIGTYACPQCGKDSPHTHPTTGPAEPRAAEGAGMDGVVRPLGSPSDYSYGSLEDGLNLAAELNGTKPTAAAVVPAGGEDAVAWRVDWIASKTGELSHHFCMSMDRVDDMAQALRNAVPPTPPTITPLYTAPAPRGGVTEAMVNRFLGWPLPDTVNPDGTYPAGEFRKKFTVSLSGTNLLDATEARAMLEYVLQTPPAAQAQDAGPKARHWREAISLQHGTAWLNAIEQEARALAAKE